MTWGIIVAFILFFFLSILIYGIFTMGAGMFIRVITHNDSDEILFTFDDGPHPLYTPLVLALLKSHQRKAMFFCIGQHAEKYPELVRKIHDDGHIIGNHTYTHHPRNTFSSHKAIEDEINATNKVIAQIIGHQPTLFRPPYGVTNPSIAKAIRKTKMQTIGWNIRSFDTITSNPKKIVRRVLNRIRPGCIILMHDTSQTSVEALAEILDYLEK